MESKFEKIEELISSEKLFYAHKKEDKRETLKEHTNRCETYFSMIWKDEKEKQVLGIIKEDIFKGKLSEDGENLLKKMWYGIPTFHDIGKINPKFQKEKMENLILENLEDFAQLETKHSMLSALLYLDFFLQKILMIPDKTEKRKLKFFLLLNTYIISRHHTNLEPLEKILEKTPEGVLFQARKGMEKSGHLLYMPKLSLYIDEEDFELKGKGFTAFVRSGGGFDRTVEELSNFEKITMYGYVRLFYSILIASDYYATSEFMSGNKINEFEELQDIEDFYNAFEDGEIQKSIRNYEKRTYGKTQEFSTCKDINILRNELFLDAQQMLQTNESERIFYLEAPTGSGKSNVAFHLSFLLAKKAALHKIFYVYPFNTLIEQNITTLHKIFKEKKELFEKIAVLNSVTAIKCNSDRKIDKSIDSNEDLYEKALLNRQFLNYPIVVTTNVSLFQLLFDNRQSSVMGFYQLMNSVIILDEVQSYKNSIWTEIIHFLQGFARLLNSKVIIMSATLPDLNYLLEESKGCVRLIKDREKYFNHNLFSKRVQMNFELLEEEISFEALYYHMKTHSTKTSKILIEFITKKAAESYYKFVMEKQELEEPWIEVKLMTGDDNIIDRKNIIQWTKTASFDGPCLLISTQVIEAGIDIDMNIGYKDISFLDSEEQFAGRINRSAKRKQEVVYFFNMDKAQTIYPNDVRTTKKFTLVNSKMQEILVTKEFSKFYSPVLEEIKEKNRKCNYQNTEDFFSKTVGMLNMPEIKERMQLINDNRQKVSVFLNRRIHDAEGNCYNGEDIWRQYKELLKNQHISYAKKQVLISEIKSKMQFFIYEIETLDFNADDQIGELYYIEDSEKYFVNHRFSREKFEAEQKWI